ncbi:hypothetical protein PCANC_28878 [Puccinia coronata f. sp. avenae]|nr:hypothetical protein PCANC_28878 [Puccinia coronata f. sp. avenae]
MEAHITQNAAPLAKAVETIYTELYFCPTCENSYNRVPTNNFATGKKNPEALLPKPTEQLVAQELVSSSDVEPDIRVATQNAKVEPQHTLETATALTSDATPVQPERMIEAELPPTDFDSADTAATNSQEAKDSLSFI